MRDKLILLSTLLIVFPLISFATDFYIATTALNIRTGGGTEYSVSFTLQKGDEVEILAINNGWYKIKYFEKTGYAHSKYLRYSRTISDTKFNELPQLYIVIGAFICIVILAVWVSLFRNLRDKKLLETVTKTNRGTKTERDLVLTLLKFGTPKESIFHDLYVEKKKGDFSQIDLAVITDIGIIVFEVKDYSGWIYGTGSQTQWTQVLAYGNKKYRLYNPIMQNNRHIVELRKQLNQFENIPFYSIVVFYGDCVLKEINYVPDWTFIVKSERAIEVLKKLMGDNKSIEYFNKNEVVRILKESVINGGVEENQIIHKQNIKDMLGKHRIFE